jgi:glutaredoxin
MFFLRTCGFLGLLGWAILGSFSPSDAQAQQIYRIVGPDGRMTFSDKPPLEPTARPTVAPVVPLTGGTGSGTLPFELRQAATRYPVMLYSGPGCAPCGAGRALLSGRGIPFAEKTVSTNEDIDALKRLAGVATLPILTVGSQQLKGYSEVEWTQFLDAAGYPKTSQLPVGYSRPPASPLVIAQQPAAPADAAPAEPPSAAIAPPAPAENPTGIRF